MAIKTVSVCGYGSSGSSAFLDILREYDNVQVMDNGEFYLLHFVDGIRDLDYQLNNHMMRASSAVAIHRFRKIINKKLYCSGRVSPADREKIKRIAEEYLQQIIMCSYRGPMRAMRILESKHLFGSLEYFVHKAIGKIFPLHRMPFINIELSINHPQFDELTRNLVAEILGTVYKNSYVENEQEIKVIDQLIPAYNPENYLKYVENSAAIIVDRDPRDNYLFGKLFLVPSGRIVFPCDNVENYIKYIRTTRQAIQENKNVALFKFEELIYDCDNTAKRLADFVGAGNRVRKGECFKPTYARSSSQLFKKYTQYDSDIKKIEQELPEFLFPFENYPDIASEGKIARGSQYKNGFR
jgi:hypothetical protein